MKLDEVVGGRPRNAMTVTISIGKDDREFCKTHDISLSKLVRIAIQGLREAEHE